MSRKKGQLTYCKALPSGQNRRKNSLREYVFVNSAQNTVPYCQNYTLTDRFFRRICPLDNALQNVNSIRLDMPDSKRRC